MPARRSVCGPWDADMASVPRSQEFATVSSSTRHSASARSAPAATASNAFESAGS